MSNLDKDFWNNVKGGGGGSTNPNAGLSLDAGFWSDVRSKNKKSSTVAAPPPKKKDSGILAGLKGAANLPLEILSILDTPRAALVAGAKELGDGLDYGIEALVGKDGFDLGPITIKPTGDGEVSLDQFKENFNRRIGVGDVIEDSNPDLNPWVKRGIGFAGDVLIDPLTYVTVGAAKAPTAAKATGRLVSADNIAKNLMNLGPDARKAATGIEDADDSLRAIRKMANEVLTHNSGTRLSKEAADVLDVNVGAAFRGAVIPGTHTAARGLNTAKTAVKDATWGRLTSSIKDQSLWAKFERVPGTRMIREAFDDVAAMDWMQARRQATRTGTLFRYARTNELGQLIQSVGDDVDWLSVRDAIETQTVKNLDGAERESAEQIVKFLDGIKKDYKKETGQELGFIEGGYFPRFLTDDMLERFKQTGRPGATQSSPVRRRGLRKDAQFLGRTLETGSVDEIEAIARAEFGPGYQQIFNDDPLATLAMYVQFMSRQMSDKTFLSNLADVQVYKDGVPTTLLRFLDEGDLYARDAAAKADKKTADLIRKSATSNSSRANKGFARAEAKRVKAAAVREKAEAKFLANARKKYGHGVLTGIDDSLTEIGEAEAIIFDLQNQAQDAIDNAPAPTVVGADPQAIAQAEQAVTETAEQVAQAQQRVAAQQGLVGEAETVLAGIEPPTPKAAVSGVDGPRVSAPLTGMTPNIDRQVARIDGEISEIQKLIDSGADEFGVGAEDIAQLEAEKAVLLGGADAAPAPVKAAPVVAEPQMVEQTVESGVRKLTDDEMAPFRESRRTAEKAVKVAEEERQKVLTELDRARTGLDEASEGVERVIPAQVDETLAADKAVIDAAVGIKLKTVDPDSLDPFIAEQAQATINELVSIKELRAEQKVVTKRFEQASVKGAERVTEVDDAAVTLWTQRLEIAEQKVAAHKDVEAGVRKAFAEADAALAKAAKGVPETRVVLEKAVPVVSASVKQVDDAAVKVASAKTKVAKANTPKAKKAAQSEFELAKKTLTKEKGRLTKANTALAKAQARAAEAATSLGSLQTVSRVEASDLLVAAQAEMAKLQTDLSKLSARKRSLQAKKVRAGFEAERLFTAGDIHEQAAKAGDDAGERVLADVAKLEGLARFHDFRAAQDSRSLDDLFQFRELTPEESDALALIQGEHLRQVASRHGLWGDRETMAAIDQIFDNLKPEKVGKLLKLHDSVLSRWKAYALLSPGYHARNFQTAIFMNALAGMDTARYGSMRYWPQIAKAETSEQLESALGRIRNPKLREAFREMHTNRAVLFGESGVEGIEVVNKLAGRRTGILGERLSTFDPTSLDNAAIKGNFKVAGKVETLARGPLFLDSIMKGDTLEEAMQRVVTHHFDYSDLSFVERRYLKRIIPFYTWTRNNVPVMMDYMQRKPGGFMWYLHAQRNLEAGSEEESVVPGYFKKAGAIRLPGTAQALGDAVGDIPGIGGILQGALGVNSNTGDDVMYLAPDLPFLNMNETFNTQQLMGQVTPFIKTPYEINAGKKIFNDIPFTGELAEMPDTWTRMGLGRLLSLTGGQLGLPKVTRIDGRYFLSDKDAYKIEQALPILGRTRRLAPSEEKYDDRQMTSVLSVIFGVGSFTNTKDAQASELRNRQRVLSDAIKRDQELQALMAGS